MKLKFSIPSISVLNFVCLPAKRERDGGKKLILILRTQLPNIILYNSQ